MLASHYASASKTSYPEPLTDADVQVQLARLSLALEHLQTDAAELIARLNPVLIPEGKADPKPCAVEPGASTSLGESINAAARAVRNVSDSVRDAISRLGI